MNDPAAIAAIGLAGTLFTGLVVLIGYLLTRPKTDAEAGNQQAQGYASLTASQGEWMDRLERRVDVLEADNRDKDERRQKAERQAAAAERRAEAAEQRAAAGEERSDRLELRVDQLERALEANHIEVPPENATPGGSPRGR